MRTRTPKRQYDILPTNWCNYPGNKRKIIEQVLDFIPRGTKTFLDLFGGTGFVTANAYHNGLIEKAVVNEFEFDQAELLAFMADNDPEEIIKYYEKAWKHWFPESAKEFPDSEVIIKAEKPRWKTLVDYYNKHKVRFDEKKEDYLRRRDEVQLGLKLVRTNTLNMHEWKEARRRSNPYIILMILVRLSIKGMPRWREDGRRFGNSCVLDTARKPIKAIKPFLDVWHDMYENDALQIYSHNFMDFYIHGYPHTRPRPEGNPNGRKFKLKKEEHKTSFQPQEKFVGLISEFGEKDFVYLDPPYLNSNAGYNVNWTAAMEIQLLALMEMLQKLEIPYLLNNNLMYDNAILAAWCDVDRYNKRSPKKTVYVLDKGYEGKKGREVFVTNRTDLKPSWLKDGLRKVDKRTSIHELLGQRD